MFIQLRRSALLMTSLINRHSCGLRQEAARRLPVPAALDGACGLLVHWLRLRLWPRADGRERDGRCVRWSWTQRVESVEGSNLLVEALPELRERVWGGQAEELSVVLEEGFEKGGLEGMGRSRECWRLIGAGSAAWVGRCKWARNCLSRLESLEPSHFLLAKEACQQVEASKMNKRTRTRALTSFLCGFDINGPSLLCLVSIN